MYYIIKNPVTMDVERTWLEHNLHDHRCSLNCRWNAINLLTIRGGKCNNAYCSRQSIKIQFILVVFPWNNAYCSRGSMKYRLL